MTSSELVFSPYTVSVSEADLADLSDRLDRTRWPDQLDDQEWVYGTDRTALQELVQYWSKEFDWRAFEARLNTYPQFSTTIDNENVHFIHVKSGRTDATPLLLTHGWPGSVAEFIELIEPLTNPADASDPAFHVVIPSLPGFGLSGPTTTTGVSPQRIAKILIRLMGGLGYSSYVAQGGDWGGIITGFIGKLDPQNCAGIHMNMVPVRPTEELLADMSEHEQLLLGRLMSFQDNEVGYQAIQGTKPQTLAYAMADSPAGLLGWILEKFRSWSDCNGEVFQAHSRDSLLANVALYWFTNTAGSASRIYYEFKNVDKSAVASGVDVPTGVADFHQEIYRSPRRWVASAFNLVHWSEFESGGHFAALEQPALLVGDIRSFVRSLE